MMLRLFLYLIFGGDRMAIVTVYVTLILAGRRTFAQVPTTLQPAVEADLASMGLGTDGQPLSEGE